MLRSVRSCDHVERGERLIRNNTNRTRLGSQVSEHAKSTPPRK